MHVVWYPVLIIYPYMNTRTEEEFKSLTLNQMTPCSVKLLLVDM